MCTSLAGLARVGRRVGVGGDVKEEGRSRTWASTMITFPCCAREVAVQLLCDLRFLAVERDCGLCYSLLLNLFSLCFFAGRAAACARRVIY